MSVKDFQTYCLSMSQGVQNSDCIVDNAGIVPAAFNPLQYVKYPRFFERDATLR